MTQTQFTNSIEIDEPGGGNAPAINDEELIRKGAAAVERFEKLAREQILPLKFIELDWSKDRDEKMPEAPRLRAAQDAINALSEQVEEGEQSQGPVDALARSRRSEAARKRWQDPEYRKRQSRSMSEAMRKRWQDPEQQRRIGEVRRKLWHDPAYRRHQVEVQRATWRDPERRRRTSEAMREAWRDPELRRRMSEIKREAWRDSELRRRMSEAIGQGLRKAWSDPERRRRMSEVKSEAIRESWCDPVVRELRTLGLRKKCLDLEFIERRRKSLIRHYDLVALGRKLCEEAGLEPAPDDELAMLAEMILEETGVES